MGPGTTGQSGRRLGPNLATAGLATVAAMTLMFWSRDAFQIRTLPERVMEWVLLFLPPDALESGIGRFGAQAKVYALYVAVGGMAAILLVAGTLLLALAGSSWTVWAAGPLLYLIAMGAIMPITGGGLFATDVPQDFRLVNACYLGIALAYASILLLPRILSRVRAGPPVGRHPLPTADSPRRAFLAGAVPSIASFLAVLWLGQSGGSGASSLPLAKIEPAPSPIPSPPPPAAAVAAPTTAAAQTGPPPTAPPAPVGPASVSTPAPAPAPAPPTPESIVAPTAEPTAVPPPAPTTEPALPIPSPMGKQIARGEYGAITAGGREPGTLADLITESANHYHVTKNPVSDPVLQPGGWRLTLDGEVRSPVQLDYRTLRQLPAVAIAKTLECVSNYTSECELVPFGCDLISTAAWKGVPLTVLLDLAGGLKPGVVSVSLLGADEFTSVIPAEVALDPETLVAYEMNGEVLPYEHGYPARVLVPGRYGYKSAKWLRGVRPMDRQVLDWYAQRNWNKDGLVRTMTRIDVPATAATLPPGQQRAAGIAYAADRGVSKVELSADGGRTWQPVALLEPAPGRDAWVRWEGRFELPPGQAVRLVARATDGSGRLQTQEFTLPAPDGATGWHSILVRGQ